MKTVVKEIPASYAKATFDEFFYSQSSAGRQEAGQPGRHIAAKRLACSYWIAIVLGIFAVFLSAFGMMAQLPFFHGVVFSIFTGGQIAIVLSILGTYRTHYDAANKCCISQQSVIAKLGRENVDFLYDAVKSGGTAAGQSRSAAVVQFPTDGDVA